MTDVADFTDILDKLDMAEQEVQLAKTEKYRPSFSEASYARRGAFVISVDGEFMQSGGKTISGRGFLGYLIEITDTPKPEYMRIRFSTPDIRNSKILTSPRGNIEKVIEDPLSLVGADAPNPDGFLVKRKTGIRILEDGDLVLVSPSGIFAGSNGWAVAKEWQEKYRDLLYEYYSIQETYESLVSEHDRTEQEVMEEKNHIADLQEKEIWYQNTLTQAKAELEDMHRILINYKSMLPSLSEQNMTLQTELENMISNVVNRVHKLTTSVLALETTEYAYMVQSKLPAEVGMSVIKQEKERLKDAEIIEGDIDEKSEDSTKGSGTGDMGTGGNTSGGKDNGKQDKESGGKGGNPSVPASRNEGTLKKAIRGFARLQVGTDGEDADEDENGSD